MRIDIVSTKVYPFEELSEEAKETAVELLWDINAYPEWWDSTYADAAQIGLKITEFDIDRGSYCRGDWTEDAEDVAKLIIENHGEMCETYKDAKTFLTEYENEQLAYFQEPDYDPDYMAFGESEKYEEIASEFLRTICEDYRIMLQEEYEYLSSEAAIIEAIKANEYEFTEDGKLY